MKQPELLSIQRMFDTLTAENIIPPRHFYSDGFGVVIGMSHFLKPFIKSSSSPYLLEDYRIGIITQGSMHGIINLQEYTVGAGNILFVTPGTIVEPLGMSDDFCIAGMGVPSELLHLATVGSSTCLTDGKMKHGIQPVNGEQQKLLEHMFQTLWETANAEKAMQETNQTASSASGYHGMATTLRLVGAIATFYDSLFQWHYASTATHGTAVQSSTASDTFNRFIQLVNLHCRKQRTLGFYASKLCLTDRYLGTVVRQASGITAKEWIDKAVITQAKVMLRHGNKQVAEITEDLHFPNPSFFCKYFKRLVGCTPQEYRQGKES